MQTKRTSFNRFGYGSARACLAAGLLLAALHVQVAAGADSSEPLPNLTVTLSAKNLVLSWPASATGFVLQYSANLGAGASWVQVTTPPSTSGSVTKVTLPIGSGTQFYRLVAREWGTVNFNNRVTGVVDARVLLPDGTAPGADFTAQLFGGPAGTAIDLLMPLFPTTTFRTSSAGEQGFVNPVVVTVPGVPPGALATLVMRWFNGPDYASSSIRGETPPCTITLGGGLLPPANLSWPSLTPVPCSVRKRS